MITSAGLLDETGIAVLSPSEIDCVSGGGISVEWTDSKTNWGEVAVWTAGGIVAGARGGIWGAVLGGIGGGGAAFASQHVKINFS